MFRIHRLFIKTAIIYFVLGVLLGGFLLLNKALRTIPYPYALVTVHNHLITVGFIAMMIMGVAYWMFPRQPGTTKEAVAKDPLAWVNYILLNLGLILRAVAEPFYPASWTRGALAASAILQTLGVLSFVVGIWNRVRPPSTFPRM